MQSAVGHLLETDFPGNEFDPRVLKEVSDQLTHFFLAKTKGMKNQTIFNILADQHYELINRIRSPADREDLDDSFVKYRQLINKLEQVCPENEIADPIFELKKSLKELAKEMQSERRGREWEGMSLPPFEKR